MLTLLGERSQQNSYFKHVIATYLYATGASRQALSVIAHLGISSSYPTIAAGSTELPQNPKHDQVSLTEQGSKSPVTQLEDDSTVEQEDEEGYQESEASNEDSDSDSIVASDSDSDAEVEVNDQHREPTSIWKQDQVATVSDFDSDGSGDESDLPLRLV